MLRGLCKIQVARWSFCVFLFLNGFVSIRFVEVLKTTTAKILISMSHSVCGELFRTGRRLFLCFSHCREHSVLTLFTLKLPKTHFYAHQKISTLSHSNRTLIYCQLHCELSAAGRIPCRLRKKDSLSSCQLELAKARRCLKKE